MSNGAATQERLPPTILSEEDEARFQGAFAKIVARRKKMGLPLDPNPDINDLFDYRGAWKAGKLDIDEFGHFSSEFKSDEHPNLIVEGRNTKTGEPKRPPGLTSEFLKRQLRDRQDVLRMFEQEEMAHRLEFGEPGAISELEDSIRRGQSVEIEKFNQGLQEGHRLQERMRPSFKGKGLPEQQIAEEGQVHPLVAIARSIGQGPEEFLRTTARELVREPQNGVGREVSKFLQKADPVLGVLMGGVSPGNAQRALKLFESQLRGGVRVGKTGAATLEKAAKGNPLFKRLLKSEDIGGDLQVLRMTSRAQLAKQNTLASSDCNLISRGQRRSKQSNGSLGGLCEMRQMRWWSSEQERQLAAHRLVEYRLLECLRSWRLLHAVSAAKLITFQSISFPKEISSPAQAHLELPHPSLSFLSNHYNESKGLFASAN